jgi:hypothetical protein
MLRKLLRNLTLSVLTIRTASKTSSRSWSRCRVPLSVAMAVGDWCECGKTGGNEALCSWDFQQGVEIFIDLTVMDLQVRDVEIMFRMYSERVKRQGLSYFARCVST